MAISLQSKNVLITGASAGIGAACAHEFAKCGANLILVARRGAQLIELSNILKQNYGVECTVLELDVRDNALVLESLASLPSQYREIDILVNNAGLVIGVEKAHETPEADVDTMLDTNVKGLLNMIRGVVPGMVKRNSGQVINISSIAGHEAYAGGSIYCASKHAVDAITKSLRMDVVETNLRVGAISPGLVETEFSIVRFKGDTDRASSVYAGLESLVGQDIAEAVLFTATRPPHVQIADLIIFPTSQAAATVVHRDT